MIENQNKDVILEVYNLIFNCNLPKLLSDQINVRIHRVYRALRENFSLKDLRKLTPMVFYLYFYVKNIYLSKERIIERSLEVIEESDFNTFIEQIIRYKQQIEILNKKMVDKNIKNFNEI